MKREMSKDASDLENISAKSRPMQIMEMYQKFCSQGWLEAKASLDECSVKAIAKLDEAKKCEFLINVLRVCCMFTRYYLKMINVQLYLKDLTPYSQQAFKGIRNVSSEKYLRIKFLLRLGL